MSGCRDIPKRALEAILCVPGANGRGGLERLGEVVVWADFDGFHCRCSRDIADAACGGGHVGRVQIDVRPNAPGAVIRPPQVRGLETWAGRLRTF